MIKTCKYLVCVDADISDLVLDFIRDERPKTQFIWNEYKNYKGIKAIHCKNEYSMVNKMKECIKNEEPFLKKQRLSDESKKRVQTLKRMYS